MYINFDEDGAQFFRIPAKMTNKIEFRYLEAPSMRETKEIS